MKLAAAFRAIWSFVTCYTGVAVILVEIMCVLQYIDVPILILNEVRRLQNVVKLLSYIAYRLSCLYSAVLGSVELFSRFIASAWRISRSGRT